MPLTTKILICVNQDDFSEGFFRTLEISGMNFRRCLSDGNAAYSEICEYEPDIVLCDTLMTNYDALSLIEKVNSTLDKKPFSSLLLPAKTHFLNNR